MSEAFPTGKVLVHMANYGCPAPGSKRKFWAKSYGNSQMKKGDIVRVMFQHETSTHPRNRILTTRTEEWVVTEVKGPADGSIYKDVITYYEHT